MVSVETISIVFTGLSISLAAFYYISTLRNAQRTRELTLKTQEQAFETRQIQFCWQALERVHSTEFMRRIIDILYRQDFKDYEEWREKYGPSTNPDAFVDYYNVTSAFQGIGYLVQSEALNLETLSKHILPRTIVLLWEKIEPVVKAHRETLNPAEYDSFEYLADELRTLTERRIEQAMNTTE